MVGRMRRMIRVSIKLARKVQRLFLIAGQFTVCVLNATDQALDVTGQQGVSQELGEAEGTAVLPFICLQMKIALKSAVRERWFVKLWKRWLMVI